MPSAFPRPVDMYPNKEAARPGPEMRQTKKGNQWYFGMKAY